MEQSIFMDKSQVPAEADLKNSLGQKYSLWMEVRDQDSGSGPISVGGYKQIN